MTNRALLIVAVCLFAGLAVAAPLAVRFAPNHRGAALTTATLPPPEPPAPHKHRLAPPPRKVASLVPEEAGGLAKQPDDLHTVAPLPSIQRPHPQTVGWTYRTPSGTGWALEATPWPDRLNLLVESPRAERAVFRVSQAYAALGRPELDRRVERLRALLPPGPLGAVLFDVAPDGTVKRLAE